MLSQHNRREIESWQVNMGKKINELAQIVVGPMITCMFHVPCPCMNLTTDTVYYANVKDEKLFLIKIIACERTRVIALGS